MDGKRTRSWVRIEANTVHEWLLCFDDAAEVVCAVCNRHNHWAGPNARLLRGWFDTRLDR